MLTNTLEDSVVEYVYSEPPPNDHDNDNGDGCVM